jgi:hypothetical protein
MSEKKDELKRMVEKIVWFESKQMSNWNFMSKLKTESGGTYTLFHTKRDWSETKAFATLKSLPMSWIGMTVEFVYKEEEFEKEWKTFKSKKLLWISRVKEPSVKVSWVDVPWKVVWDNLESIKF